MPITAPEASSGRYNVRRQDEPLLSANLRLRPLVEKDAPRLAILGDGWKGAAAAYDFELGGGVLFGVERLRDNQLIGCCGFVIKEEIPCARCWIGRPFQDKGHGLEAIRRLIRFIFDDLEFAAATVGVMPENSARARALEKKGFRFQEPRASYFECDKKKEILHFSIKRDDWLKERALQPVILVSAAAMVDTGGRVLLARRPQDKPMGGLWEFPGGKMAQGETPEAALIRELWEELGVEVANNHLAPLGFASHSYEELDFHLLMPIFTCRTWRGAVTPLEGQELCWTRPADMVRLPMPLADRPLAPLVRSFLG